ncbi:MAG: NfeD family protein [Bacteroidales bacterium]|nr:NfeD family protein [Bacteroidales bacterium]MCF8388333.1 NfeD family protein [Bacteroidales bacterium]MCF8398056.1 NfeD family protein [Bacteroidales bacterium]
MIWVVVALIAIGLLFLILEILVFPGQAVAGIIGIALLIIGIWQSYLVLGSTTGNWILVGTLAASIGLLIFALRSKTWKRAMLSDDIDGKVNVIDQLKIKVGDEGKTISRLNPVGKALINDDYYEVHTQGDFVDPGTEVIVTKISFNKIYVKRKIDKNE